MDDIRNLVYGPDSLAEGSFGTVTLFLDDVAISTNVPVSPGERAIGTRVSAAVRHSVLDQGHTWVDYAFVVNTGDMVSSGEVLQISRNLIRPFYRSRAEQAVEWLHTDLSGYPFYVHKPEGAIFLWLWFPDLPISSQGLYRRLKQRGVLVIAGEHFFPGLEGEWRHQHECIRVTYSQDEDSVRAGIRAIAEEVKSAYDSSPSHARTG